MTTPACASPRVLYIVYWGAAEPLGQSLVLPAVKRLAALGARLTLVTFEKPEDLADRAAMEAIRLSLTQSGVRWIALRYHKRPKVPATAWDIAQGVCRSLVLRLRGRYDIVHARTYIGGLIGMSLAPLVRAKFVYHNEGFYPDEQVDAGVWQYGSTVHRFARHLEHRMYARADGLIVLSRRAERVVSELPAVARRATPVIVVPSCVDLDRFSTTTHFIARQKDVRLVYIGSFGGRYPLDKIARFVAVAHEELGSVQIRVLTPADRKVVHNALQKAGLPHERSSIAWVSPDKVPAELACQHAGISFLNCGRSEHAGSPTKNGEYWASGLPVITTPNVSDVEEIIHEDGVGLIVREHTDEEYCRAARELSRLLADPTLPARCRRAAERHYSLSNACERQFHLYVDLRSAR